MSIESHKPALSSRAPAATDPHGGKNTGKGSLAATGNTGFSLLFSALAADDTVSGTDSTSTSTSTNTDGGLSFSLLPSVADTHSLSGINPLTAANSPAPDSAALGTATPADSAQNIAVLVGATGACALPPATSEGPCSSVPLPIASAAPAAPVLRPTVALSPSTFGKSDGVEAATTTSTMVPATVPDVAAAGSQPIMLRKPVVHVATSATPGMPNEGKSKPEIGPATLFADASPIVQMANLAEAWVAVRERPATKPNSSSGGSGTDSLFGAALTPPGAAGSDYTIAEAAAVVPETALAETVSYWVSHDVQNAELTLDGFGDDPVQVSISMQGEQTQIDFRCDQLEVRQALENAAPELKELLSNQGLSLAGWSVGSSGRDNMAGDAPPRQRQDNRKALLIKTQDVATIGQARGHMPVGRSLDIFV